MRRKYQTVLQGFRLIPRGETNLPPFLYYITINDSKKFHRFDNLSKRPGKLPDHRPV